MKENSVIIKRVLSFLLIFLLSINGFAATVDDNDGAAFITKAEFDALKNNFQNQLDKYNQSIDSKIDNAIASYLNGIKISKVYQKTLLCSNVESVECLYLPNDGTGVLHYEWAPVGLTLHDHSAYLNWSQNTTGWTIMISANLTHVAENMHKLLIKKLDKTNKWALWAGFTEDATENWMGENYWFSNAQKTGLAIDAVPSFDGHFARVSANGSNFYFKPVNGRPSRSNSIAWTGLRFTGDTADWTNSYNFTSIIKNDGDVKYKNAIIFKAKAENRFTPQDEVLGFANIWPRGNNVRMKVKEVCDNLNASIYCTLPPGDVFKNQHTEYNAAPVNPDDDQNFSNTYNKYYPGEKWADSYITNWNQLYTDDYGAVWGPGKDSYLPLYAGIPFLTVSKNEVVKYDIEFADPTEAYEIYAMTCPFTDEGATYVSYDDVVKLSIDGINYYDSVWVQGSNTLYMDFKTKNIIDSDKTVFLKWSKRGGTDGGGELIIKDHTIAEITLKD